MSMLRSGWTVLALALVPPALFAQDAARVAFDSASLAWDAGRYPEALGRLERLLTGPSRDTLRRPIALLTGEYYRTIELAPDGQDLVWSRDGRRLAFGTAVAEVPRTIVLRFGDDGRVAGADTLPGRRAVFSPDGGSIAYESEVTNGSNQEDILVGPADGTGTTITGSSTGTWRTASSSPTDAASRSPSSDVSISAWSSL